MFVVTACARQYDRSDADGSLVARERPTDGSGARA